MAQTATVHENCSCDYQNAANGVCRLLEIIVRLRAPDGCPWDREQTPQSVMKYLLEETYELLDAIEQEEPEEVAEELGDLLFMLLFLARIYEEQGHFRVQDAMAIAARKMIRRHPHIFGNTKINGTEDVIANWQRIKEQEAKDKGVTHSALGNLPKTLPALQLAFRAGERASRTGFDWADVQGVWAKMKEEERELLQAVEQRDADAVRAEFGDLLFTLANMARHLSINPEEALKQAVRSFMQRFQAMEEFFANQGRKLVDVGMQEMDEVWKQVK
ncbi:MAG: nucleoside triphosphate pyrophosphohydrolase [Dissulfuribacterales bacterium]